MVAAALEEAALQGAHLPFHTVLVAGDAAVDRTRLLEIADRVSLDLERFQQAIGRTENSAQQAERVENARNRGIVLTPSIIVNDQRFVGVLPYGDLEEIILNLLSPL